MGNDSDAIKKMHEEQGHEIIEKLQKKLIPLDTIWRLLRRLLPKPRRMCSGKNSPKKMFVANTESQVLKRKFTILRRLWRNKNRKSGDTNVPPLFCSYLSLPGLCLLADCFLWLRPSPSFELRADVGPPFAFCSRISFGSIWLSLAMKHHLFNSIRCIRRIIPDRRQILNLDEIR